jgi:hypothetical protein
MFPNIAYAQVTPGLASTTEFIAKFNEIILFPIIALLTAVALLIFIYGCFQYIVHADDASAREEGRKHIMWGIVGLFIMLTAFAVLSLAANTFGLQGELDCADNPTAANCDDRASLNLVPLNADPYFDCNDNNAC